MLSLQQIRIIQRIEIDHAIPKRPNALLVESQITEAQRIEHRRDPRRGALRIMRDHGGTRGPTRQRTRLHLTFQIVGMCIDDTRDQVIAIHIARGTRR